MGFSYTDAGFDNFLSRSIDNLSQVNLDSAGPQSTAKAFDRTQVSGSLGDSLSIGNIILDGRKGRITISDDNNNTVVIIGELDA